MSKLKTTLLAAVGMIGAGLQATPTASINMSKTNDITVSAKRNQEKKVIKQEKEIEFNMTGGLNYIDWHAGTPPKQYGQWLQYNKKQIWNKRKK